MLHTHIRGYRALWFWRRNQFNSLVRVKSLNHFVELVPHLSTEVNGGFKKLLRNSSSYPLHLEHLGQEPDQPWVCLLHVQFHSVCLHCLHSLEEVIGVGIHPPGLGRKSSALHLVCSFLCQLEGLLEIVSPGVQRCLYAVMSFRIPFL